MSKIHLFAAIAAVATFLVACKEKEDPIIPEVSVSPSSVTFEAEGGTLNVAVSTNIETYTVSGAPEWLTVEQNGMEIALTAAENIITEELSATLTVKAETASCTIEVKQKAGSPYRGYTVMASAGYEYSGTMLYQFLKPQGEYDGGQGFIILKDEDGNTLTAWVYTELFESEEQVELTKGTYKKGQDEYPTLYAQKLTWCAGKEIGLDDEAYVMGSYYTDAISAKDVAITDGTIEVFEENGAMVIKADMVDGTGKEYKMVYTGEVEINTEGATYPSEDTDHIDVAETLFAAQCHYYGDAYGNGTTRFLLYLYSGSEEDYVLTTYEFLAEAKDYSADMDLTGSFVTASSADEDPESEGYIAPMSAGTVIPGSLIEMEGFSFPTGTYVMYGYGDYLIGNMYNSLMLTKQEDGKYTLNGVIMNEVGDFVMFLNKADLEIPVIDATVESDED